MAAQGEAIVPLVGARTRQRLAEALPALDVTLTADDLAEIEKAVPQGAARGDRYPAGVHGEPGRGQLRPVPPAAPGDRVRRGTGAVELDDLRARGLGNLSRRGESGESAAIVLTQRDWPWVRASGREGSRRSSVMRPRRPAPRDGGVGRATGMAFPLSR